MQLDERRAEEKTRAHTKTFASNYALSKNWAEHALERNKGEVPLVICRAGIVTNSLLEPYPFYMDTIQFMNALTLGVGTGILNFIEQTPD